MKRDVAVRPVTNDDIPRVLGVFARMDAVEFGQVVTSQAEVANAIAASDIGAWITARNSEIVAFSGLRRLPGSQNLRAQFACIPTECAAAHATLEHIAANAAEHHAPAVTLWQVADGVAALWLERHGWSHIRTYLRMERTLSEARPLAPVARQSIQVQTAANCDELRLAHGLLDEALAGHWDHHPLDFETFFESQESHPGHGPGLWYLARVDGEPAGALIARIASPTATIAFLGTRERFRTQGVATQLLLTAFHELASRGAQRVSLDVDMENATHATAVYQRVGMRETFRSQQWILTPSP